MSVSKEYRTFEEYWKNCDDFGSYEVGCRAAWHARDADLSAILAQFEALAGKWRKLAYHQCSDELSALIQSVKERM